MCIDVLVLHLLLSVYRRNKIISAATAMKYDLTGSFSVLSSVSVVTN